MYLAGIETQEESRKLNLRHLLLEPRPQRLFGLGISRRVCPYACPWDEILVEISA
jgi:hypothetical protein